MAQKLLNEREGNLYRRGRRERRGPGRGEQGEGLENEKA
jgi:hypothetical protein